jgi:hypothetical protein
VYSRKVEYLYSLIYNALDLLAAQSKKGKKVGRRKLTVRVCGAAGVTSAPVEGLAYVSRSDELGCSRTPQARRG